MARPQKQTVEYFAHDADASEGKTLSILFNHFGHEGISAWWLLLERISKTRNHVIGIGNPEDVEYLSAKMHFKPEKLLEILRKMADLGAIDKPLFESGQIWCQNFVDRLESVYKVRKLDLPSKPELSIPETKLLVPETELSVPEIPQSKVKETIVKNNIFVEDSDEFRLASFLWEKIKENNPTAKAPNLQSWAKSVDLMLRIDKRTTDEIEDVITWCQADTFWMANIMSTSTLRKQFDKLTMQMRRNGSKSSTPILPGGNTNGQSLRPTQRAMEPRPGAPGYQYTE